LRKKNTPEGGSGSRLLILAASKEQRDHFVAAMKAENVWAGPPSGSALLPIQPYIEQKQGLEEGWPSFSTLRGKAIRYGAACSPRTLDIWNRYVEVYMDPKFTDQDVADIIAAVRKVYAQVIARAQPEMA
jgi:dTDP-4-amino-4,6-dideoxygalactose transaminase